MYLKEKMKKIGIFCAKKLAICIDFCVFLNKRTKNDAVFRAASALSYTSLLAIVPLFAISVAIFAVFPVFAPYKDQLQELIMTNFLPGMEGEISKYFNDFVNASAKLSTIGVIGIAVTAILLLSTIENTFNYLFKVKTARRFATKITLYWTIITLGPLLLATAFSMRGYVYIISNVMKLPEVSSISYLLSNIIPTSITTIMLIAIYMLVPNKKVKFTNALAGGIVAVILFAFLKVGFSVAILNSATYKTLYGAMATLPILLVWMYLSWAVVLFGAVVTSSLEEYAQKDKVYRENYHQKPRYNNNNRRNNYQRRDENYQKNSNNNDTRKNY